MLIIAKQSKAFFYLMRLITPAQMSACPSYTVLPKLFKYINA